MVTLVFGGGALGQNQAGGGKVGGCCGPTVQLGLDFSSRVLPWRRYSLSLWPFDVPDPFLHSAAPFLPPARADRGRY